LTQLKVLEINRWSPFEANTDYDSLKAALPRLTQLTGLRLYDMGSSLRDFQPLADLSSLQWLYLNNSARHLWNMPVPLGPWQRSLRHLITPFDVVQCSLPFLQGAERLQRITFTRLPSFLWFGTEKQRGAFWTWAAEHPSLECLGFPTHEDYDDYDAHEPLEGELLEAVLDLKQRRPGLRIKTEFSIIDVYNELLDQ
jgi:hypothetical protein